MSLALLLFGVAHAATSTTLLASKADLSGDGKPEKIQVLSNGAKPLQGVSIKIGSATVNDSQMYANVTARLIDLDVNDPAQQVLIEGSAEDGSRWFTFFAFDGKSAYQTLKVSAKSVEGAISAPGSGLLLLDNPEGFFVRRSAWTLTGSALQPVEQPFQHVGATATAKQAVTLYNAPRGADRVTVISEGGKAEILVVTTQDPTWFLVLAPDGLVGWVDGRDLSTDFTVAPLAKTGG